MTQTTIEQQRLEAAVTGIAAKWERFSADLTADERTVLGLALSEVQASTDPTRNDVAGYDYVQQLAARYVNALPIWDTLAKAIAEMTRPINWNP
jgi:hypothetical protein